MKFTFDPEASYDMRVARAMATNGFYTILASRTPGGTNRYRVVTTDDAEPDPHNPYAPKRELLRATKIVAALTGLPFNSKYIAVELSFESSYELAERITRALKQRGILPADAERIPYQEL
jgi:hypothetical protein